MWISRITYLEGVEIFFILLTLFLFLKTLQNKNIFAFGAVLA